MYIAECFRKGFSKTLTPTIQNKEKGSKTKDNHEKFGVNGVKFECDNMGFTLGFSGGSWGGGEGLFGFFKIPVAPEEVLLLLSDFRQRISCTYGSQLFLITFP